MNMAWRNIWRNPRRTFVILTAVFVGVTGMVFLAAMSKGMVYSMVENSMKEMTGHILIRNADFIADPSIENRINDIDSLLNKLQLPEGSKAVKRIKLEGMLNTARDSLGVQVIGTDISKEAGLSFIADAEIYGEIYTPEDKNAVLIGRSLSEKIGLGIGKRVVISMQGASGEIASRAFRIKGIFKAGRKQQEDMYIFTPYASLEKMLGINGAGTEISIVTPERDINSPYYDELAVKLQKAVPAGMSVMSWRKVLPALSAYLGMFDGFMFIWYFVVFIAMGFGIVNTVLMAVYERMREFGLMRALGVKTSGIFGAVLTETSILLLVGLLIGNAVSGLMIWYFAAVGMDLSAFSSGMDMFAVSRVIYPVVTLKDLLIADLTIFVLGVLVAVYPAYKACGFSPVETMINV